MSENMEKHNNNKKKRRLSCILDKPPLQAWLYMKQFE